MDHLTALTKQQVLKHSLQLQITLKQTSKAVFSTLPYIELSLMSSITAQESDKGTVLGAT